MIIHQQNKFLESLDAKERVRDLAITEVSEDDDGLGTTDGEKIKTVLKAAGYAGPIRTDLTCWLRGGVAATVVQEIHQRQDVEMREAARVVALVVVFAAGVAAQQNDTRSAVPVPSCPWPCSDYHQPVCGNNGKTYANPCRLHEAAACENPCIKQMSVGPCEIPCPEVCIQVYQPVCGSDGRTYGNTCHLAIARCEDPCIEFMHNGECGGPCPRKCTKEYKPVCGSNSRTYHNLCALNSATVCDDPCISLRNEGPCVHNCGDPCQHPVSDELVCGTDGTTYLSQCHLEEAACNNPCLTVVHGGACGGGGGGGGGEPGCHSICPKYHDPVCGSNSKTYNNLCELNNAQRCESRCITLRAKGNCAHTCGDPCLFSDKGVCGTDGNTYPNQCVLEEAACHNPCLAVRHQGPCKDQECPRICTQDYNPVCGSNSKTYHNLCALNSASECDDPCITLRNEGPCEHTCGEPCPLLIDQQLAVCGSDGTTYSSRCHLEEAACHQPCLTVQHTGPCDSEGCHIVCPLHIDPVCGTDGKTYGNMCALSAAIRCNNDPCLTLRAVGPCQRKCGDPCPIFEHHASVCGSDGITYPSQCHLEEAACHNPCLVVEHQSQCDSQPCPRNCPLFFDLVCGTDGITYMNQCTLNNASLCLNNCIGLRGKGPCTRECGDPCPMPQLSDAVCSSDGTTYPSQCHLDEAACHNPCISTAHAGPCGSGSEKCCIEDMRTFPEINVKLSCHQGNLLAEATGQIPPNPSVCRFAGHGYDLGEQLEDLCFPMTCTAEGWVPVGPISDCCAHCLLYGDLHVFTFENELYHLHDSCNYSVAQIGSSFNPPVGVFTIPVPCKENQYPCFSSTTFKNDPLTVVTILHDDIYKINVNGVDFEVAENGVMVLENVGVNDHLPVLAWRGSCGIFLAGSSGITVCCWASSALFVIVCA
ncbi:hypothetical protein O3P69_014620 [Scylla paramamosain]|uniref:Uncharacterized protein n=1 Tax=Scylla paramamosain TaxID=85552 RepID=A0AAW0TYL2_SCYPA